MNKQGRDIYFGAIIIEALGAERTFPGCSASESSLPIYILDTDLLDEFSKNFVFSLAKSLKKFRKSSNEFHILALSMMDMKR